MLPCSPKYANVKRANLTPGGGQKEKRRRDQTKDPSGELSMEKHPSKAPRLTSTTARISFSTDVIVTPFYWRSNEAAAEERGSCDLKVREAMEIFVDFFEAMNVFMDV
jgi:hypothetical protein